MLKLTDGDWDIAAGQYFTTFRRDVHVVEDGVGGEDAADCLRYLVATKLRRIEQRKLRGLWVGPIPSASTNQLVFPGPRTYD